MCDAIFAFGQRGGHYLQCPSKRDRNKLPQRLQRLLSSNDVAHIYHVTLGYHDSFLITYRDRHGEDHIASHGLPHDLTNFLHTKDRSIPHLQLTLGPQNSSFFIGDGTSYLWLGLPTPLLYALESRIRNGAFTDKPRIVALGADDNFILITENHAAVWNLPDYRMLSRMLNYARTQQRGIEEVTEVVLHAYRYQGFVALSRNGTLLYENLPEWSLTALDRMKESFVSDSNAVSPGTRKMEAIRPSARERELKKVAEFKTKWDDRTDSMERRAKAKGLKLSLSLSIGGGGGVKTGKFW
ncbi:hypothetical protein M011DRAFT_221914 [Sporormia fimetaria CBS 119925]|uniref:Uncharacterized protein n=1 Tax=Sporormia fimetaria CBS 119925 TaxID=1340428 RepID=A0A6A6V0G8_9PLEO|nr:hypothetical protein M011DRAFT_221914 [Sporormia fimetaria CBS 119925]